MTNSAIILSQASNVHGVISCEDQTLNATVNNKMNLSIKLSSPTFIKRYARVDKSAMWLTVSAVLMMKLRQVIINWHKLKFWLKTLLRSWIYYMSCHCSQWQVCVKFLIQKQLQANVTFSLAYRRKLLPIFLSQWDYSTKVRFQRHMLWIRQAW